MSEILRCGSCGEPYTRRPDEERAAPGRLEERGDGHLLARTGFAGLVALKIAPRAPRTHRSPGALPDARPAAALSRRAGSRACPGGRAGGRLLGIDVGAAADRGGSGACTPRRRADGAVA